MNRSIKTYMTITGEAGVTMRLQYIPALVLRVLLPWLGSLAAAQSPSDAFQRETILGMMHKANAWQQAHPSKEDDRDWIRATWYTGVMAAYKATHDDGFLQQALDWGKHHERQVGVERHGADGLWSNLALADVPGTLEHLDVPQLRDL